MSDFLPYGRQAIDDDDVEAVVAALRSDFLTTGPRVTDFEAAVADAVGAAWGVAVNSGTAALHAACFAVGVDEGDRVVVPATTFLATANCARFLGAEPIFADVDPRTGLMTAETLATAMQPGVKAVIPVHLNGAVVDVEALRDAAAGAAIIEDACHAIGADGVAKGELATFSFHPVKHITTAEGGMVTGDDPEHRRRAELLRNHGMVRDAAHLENASPGPWYYEQQALGLNYRLSDLQAALGLSQLSKLSHFVERRRALAARYDAAFAEVEGVDPVPQGPGSAYHLYPVHIDFSRHTRAALMAELREEKIGTQVHYIPVPAQPYYARRGWRAEDFPGAMHYYERALSLPLYPAMTDADVDRVVEALAQRLEARSE